MTRWYVVRTYEVIADSKHEAKALLEKAQRIEKTDRIEPISETICARYDGTSLYCE